MTNRKIDRLCQSVLPPGYARVERMLPALQHFLDENLPTPINRAVSVLTVVGDEIVIAAYNPVVANYLRLHGTEIAQQIHETFGLDARLKFRTLPESMLHSGARERKRSPRTVSAASIDALKRNAEWIEDDELRAALLSLAQSMQSE